MKFLKKKKALFFQTFFLAAFLILGGFLIAYCMFPDGHLVKISYADSADTGGSSSDSGNDGSGGGYGPGGADVDTGSGWGGWGSGGIGGQTCPRGGENDPPCDSSNSGDRSGEGGNSNSGSDGWGWGWGSPPSPPSVSASASCVGSEAQVNISWSYSGSCDHVDASISGGPSGAPSILGQPCNGSHTFDHLSSNTSYNYSVAFYYTGQTVQGSFGTPNCAPPPPAVDLWGPSTVEVPNPINLGWSSSNADSCSASGDWSGGKAVNGSEAVVKPRGNYTFNLSCSGPGGSAQDSQNVQVIQVPHCTFSSDPTSIILPETATLTWDCEYPAGGIGGGGTSALSCEIDQGIGDVDPRVGFVEVRPSAGTTYTLLCIGQDGSRSFSTTVGVGFIPKLKEILPRP